MPSPSRVEITQHNPAGYGELVVGIAPCLPDLPAFFDRGDGADRITRFIDFTLDTIEAHAGFVKLQSTDFEACGLTGLATLSRGMNHARAAGIGVGLDAKRGNIGATAAACVRACLVPGTEGGPGNFEADCLTVNPLTGPDTLEPFADRARHHSKELFVLCRISNPGAGWLQDRRTDRP